MNKKLLALLAAIIILILAVVGLSQAGDDDKDKDDKKETETSMSTEESSADTEASLTISENDAVEDEDTTSSEGTPLAALVGEQSGTATLLLSSLNFPEATMTTDASGMFTLDASGLNLELLGNPELQIEDQYPVVQVVANGMAKPSEDGSVTFEVTSLTPSFYLTSPDGSRVDLERAVQQQIAAGLTSAGIEIPEVSDAAPANLPVTITPNENGTVVVETTPDADFLARFESSL